jgi:DNA-binding MarR family transcriptional regulator
MQNDNYIVVFGWMCNELGLSGTELLAFALIYGFTQDGETWFQGNRRYIAETLNISRPTVDKALNSLIDKGLLYKDVRQMQDITVNRYKVSLQGIKIFDRGCKETLQGGVKKLDRGCKDSLHKNTIDNTNNDITNDNTTLKRKKKKAATRDVYFPNDELLDKAFRDYVNMRIEIKKPFVTDEAIDKAMQKLTRLSGGNNDIAIQICNESVMNSWQGLFAIRSGGSGRSQEAAIDWSKV